MSVLKSLVLPLLAVAINVVLGDRTGSGLFYVMAVIIFILTLARLRTLFRERK